MVFSLLKIGQEVAFQGLGRKRKMVDVILVVLVAIGIACLFSRGILRCMQFLTSTGRKKHLIRRYAGQQDWMKKKGSILYPVVYWKPTGEDFRCDSWIDFLPHLKTNLPPKYWIVIVELKYKGYSAYYLTICHIHGNPNWRMIGACAYDVAEIIKMADKNDKVIKITEASIPDGCEFALQLCEGFSCAHELLYDMMREYTIDTLNGTRDAFKSPRLEQLRQLNEYEAHEILEGIRYPNRDFGRT